MTTENSTGGGERRVFNIGAGYADSGSGSTGFFNRNFNSSTSRASISKDQIDQGSIHEYLDEYAAQAAAKAAARIELLVNERLVFVEQAQKKVSRMLDESSKLMGSIKTGLERSQELTDRSIETQEKLSDEVASIKANTISALSIFVSFFAFITVTINVFSKASSVISASVLVLVFWCLLVGFNILISLQFKKASADKSLWFALGVVVLVAFGAIFGMYIFFPELYEPGRVVLRFT